jgi:hypothetical protein
MSGAKVTNAKTKLPSYIGKKLTPPPAGPVIFSNGSSTILLGKSTREAAMGQESSTPPHMGYYDTARKQQIVLGPSRELGWKNARAHGGLLGLFQADLDHHRHCPDGCTSKADFEAGRRTSWWR